MTSGPTPRGRAAVAQVFRAAGREREALVLTEGVDTMLSQPERIEETMTGVADQLDTMEPVL